MPKKLDLQLLELALQRVALWVKNLSKVIHSDGELKFRWRDNAKDHDAESNENQTVATVNLEKQLDRKALFNSPVKIDHETLHEQLK